LVPLIAPSATQATTKVIQAATAIRGWRMLQRPMLMCDLLDMYLRLASLRSLAQPGSGTLSW
jgi:hypothetical protein